MKRNNDDQRTRHYFVNYCGHKVTVLGEVVHNSIKLYKCIMHLNVPQHIPNEKLTGWHVRSCCTVAILGVSKSVSERGKSKCPNARQQVRGDGNEKNANSLAGILHLDSLMKDQGDRGERPVLSSGCEGEWCSPLRKGGREGGEGG